MNQLSLRCFPRKLHKKTVRNKQNFVSVIKSLIFVLGLVVVIVFINIHNRLEDNSIKNSFEWLRDKNFLPLYVKPDEETAIFVPRNMSAIKERKFIACFVISAPGNRLRRSAVRQTWGKLIKPIFLIGQSDKDTMKSVALEARQFNDIVIEDFVDSYINLTIKTAFAMKNFITHFNSSKYFLKIDDDAFLNVEGLYDHLENVPENSLVGQSESHSIPIRDENHHWYIPEFLFRDDIFPPYLLGISYLIPGKFIQSIFDASMNVQFMTIEDVFFTGIIAGKSLNLNLHGDRKFRVSSISIHYPCVYLKYITVHAIPPADLIELWKRIESNDECGAGEKILAKIFETFENLFDKILR